MAKTNKPLALVLMPDVPPEAAELLEAQGHLLYTPEQAVRPEVTKLDAWVGQVCWLFHPDWWLKDGQLSSHAKVMLKAVTQQAYPEKKGKKK